MRSLLLLPIPSIFASFENPLRRTFGAAACATSKLNPGTFDHLRCSKLGALGDSARKSAEGAIRAAEKAISAEQSEFGILSLDSRSSEQDVYPRLAPVSLASYATRRAKMADEASSKFYDASFCLLEQALEVSDLMGRTLMEVNQESRPSYRRDRFIRATIPIIRPNENHIFEAKLDSLDHVIDMLCAAGTFERDAALTAIRIKDDVESIETKLGRGSESRMSKEIYLGWLHELILARQDHLSSREAQLRALKNFIFISKKLETTVLEIIWWLRERANAEALEEMQTLQRWKDQTNVDKGLPIRERPSWARLRVQRLLGTIREEYDV